jgi:hypothetical protein
MKSITKEEAIELCREQYLKHAAETIKQWSPNPDYVTDEPPSECYMDKEHYETGCWFMSPPSLGRQKIYFGPVPMVGISKKTGKIVFSGLVGE